MVSYALTVLAAASAALAATPAGFTPASQTDLIVQYGSLAINGQVVQRSCRSPPSPVLRRVPTSIISHLLTDARARPQRSSASRRSAS